MQKTSIKAKENKTRSEKIISLNADAIKQELGDLVRQRVEDTLNTMLDEEADRLTNASRYERTEGRLDTRAGSYKRKLLTKAGEVELKMPRLRTLSFETAIIQRLCILFLQVILVPDSHNRSALVAQLPDNGCRTFTTF